MRTLARLFSLLRKGRKKVTLLSPDDFRQREPQTSVVKPLRLVWFLQELPFHEIDAEQVDDPPFADLSGVRHVLLSLVSAIYEKEGKAVIVLGEPGGGKTTFVKKLIKMLNEYKAYSRTVYVNVRDVGTYTCRILVKLIDELSDEVIEIVEASEVRLCKLIAMLNDKITQLVNSHKSVLIVIDNYDELLIHDYENAITLIRQLAALPMYLKKVSTVVTMTVSNYLRLLKREDFEVITKSFDIIDLRDYMVRSVDDLKKLIYAHLERHRIKNVEDPELSKSIVNILNKNPIHPFTHEAVQLLYMFYGSRMPREYVIVLRDVMESAAKARCTVIDGKFMIGYLKTDLPKVTLLKQGLSQGMLLGGLMGLGIAFFVLGILAGRYMLSAYGILLAVVGFLIYYNAQHGKF